MSITVRNLKTGSKQTENKMRTHTMTEEIAISKMGDWDPSREFSLEEAVKLINRIVVNRPQQHYENIKRDMPIEMLGIISGLLTLNDEIEVVVKLHTEIGQYNKAEFEETFMLVEAD